LYQLARTWTKRVGELELSLVAADRAASCALDADDPELAAAAAWNLAMILSAQGKTEHARDVVHRAIDALASRMDNPSKDRLAVFGALHLLGATEAAREDRRAEAHRLLDVAEQVAAKTGETNCFHLVFGPTNVALYRVRVAVELGNTGEGIDLAERVSVGDFLAVERRLTFHLDTARCYLRKRNDVAAVHMLRRVYGDSPEELRYSPVLHETLRQLKARARSTIDVELRQLIAAANLPE
jgi:hypothetical protein